MLLRDGIMSSAPGGLHAKANKSFLHLIRSEKDHLGGVLRSRPSAFKPAVRGIQVYGSDNRLLWSCHLSLHQEGLLCYPNFSFFPLSSASLVMRQLHQTQAVQSDPPPRRQCGSDDGAITDGKMGYKVRPRS